MPFAPDGPSRIKKGKRKSKPRGRGARAPILTGGGPYTPPLRRGQTVQRGKSPVPGMTWDQFQDFQDNLVQQIVPKGKPKGKSKPKPQGGGGGGISVPSSYVDPGIDYAALAGAGGGRAGAGTAPNAFRGLNPQTGQLIPLGLANRGAQTMGPEQINALIQSMIGDSYSRQSSLLQSEQERMQGQTQSNVANIQRWYGDVMKSQGIATERDAAIGAAASQAAVDQGAAIVGALGGEANQGSYVAGAAAAASAGDIKAISAIQDQYNQDITPLLQAEGAAQATREQAAGSGRLRDLSMRLAELQSEQSSKEAEMRYNVWQQNNDILNGQLDRQLAIRQANSATRQQTFNNRFGIRTANIGLQTAQQNAAQQYGLDVAGLQADAASQQQKALQHQQDQQIKLLMEQGKEAGRNYRANLSAAARNKAATFATAPPAAVKQSADTVYTLINGKDLTPQQAMVVAISVMGGYGWSVRNGAVAGHVAAILQSAGYDTSELYG